MLKRLLTFLKIVNEVKVQAPAQWQEGTPDFIESIDLKQQIKENSFTEFERKRNINSKEKIENLAEYTKDYKEYCLEKTSNQHLLKAADYKIIDKNGVTETFFIPKGAFITHNEHKTLRIESEYCVKYIQQEYNPITQMIENAYD